jgi:UDP-2,3-diacylglucosamine hydrolase
MALYIFSDAHLGAGPPDKERIKLDRIDQLASMLRSDGDRLVVLGDLFDFWFEYKRAIPKENLDILMLLRDLVKEGISVDYISGNHDFWMDDFFQNQIGAAVHCDSLEFEYAGKKLHLIHGDGLAPADRGYRLLKRVLRNRVCIWLYRKLPPDFAIALAKRVSGTSREYSARREHHFAQDYENYAQSKLNEGFDIVAIGHLHLPVYKEFPAGIYINTGDFINHFSYARMDDSGISLKYLRGHADE